MAQGSVKKRLLDDGSVRYDIVVDLGLDPLTGKRRQRKKTFRSKRDAQAALTAWLSEIDQGLAIDRSRQTVGELLEYWLDTYAKAHVRPTTLEGYDISIRKHILPVLGAIPVQKLTPEALQQFYSDKLAGGSGVRTVQLCHLHLSQALSQAMRLGLVSRNVAALVSPPRRQGTDMAVWSVEEARRFLAVVGQSTYGPIWLLALATGLRRGELLGLRWQDIDWTRGTVSIQQTVVALRGTPHISQPKTRSARRTIIVQPEVLEALKGHRRQQVERRELLGAAWQGHDLVFCSAIGTPINPNNLKRDFRRLVVLAGVPAIRIHDLRHSHITFALKEGGPIKAVSEAVGHANVSITLSVYAHVMAEQRQEVADKVGRALFGERVNDVNE